MTSVPQLAALLQRLFGVTANRLARTNGCIRRQRCLTGASLAQALICGWLADPRRTLSQLAQAAATAATPVSRQALHQRFTPAAAFLRALLQEAITHVVSGAAVAVPLVGRFSRVVVLDSTTIGLPRVLADHWRGCGNGAGAGEAALKLQARLDLGGGSLELLGPQPGRTSDRTAAHDLAPLPPGSLQIADLGYFAVPALAAITAGGSHFRSRLLTQTALFTPAGGRLLLLDLLAATRGNTADRPMLLGATQQFPCRLLLQRLSDQEAAQRLARQQEQARLAGDGLSTDARRLSHWLILVTSLPPDQLSLAEAFVLYRLRWQVELLFKRWKSLGLVDTWRTSRPDRILCEVYAKLVGALLLHWVVTVTGWAAADKSLWAATRAVQGQALLLLSSFQHGHRRLTEALTRLRTVLTTCRITAQANRPYALQRALAITRPP